MVLSALRQDHINRGDANETLINCNPGPRRL
jgi:hypothetical protein